MSDSPTYASNKARGLNRMGVRQQQRNTTSTSSYCVNKNLYDLSLGGLVKETAKRKTATARIHIGVGGVYALQDASGKIREFSSFTQQGQECELKLQLPVVGEMAGMANGWTVLIEVDE